MMKYIFVLVLLQVCHSAPLNFTPDPNLNNEIITDLKELDGNVSNMSIPNPGKYMLCHPSKCVYTFSQNLRHILKEMRTNSTLEAIIDRLLTNLKSLAKHTQNDSNCTMTTATTSKPNPFKKYIDFMRKLNTGR